MKALPLRDRALRLLTRREHSRCELQRKLAPFAEDPAEIGALLDRLEIEGWLSDARAAEAAVAGRRHKFGGLRIAYDLRRKGVADELIESAVAKVRDSELDAARGVWQRKFGELPKSAAERGRQYRFLLSRGFGADVVAQVLKGGEEQ